MEPIYRFLVTRQGRDISSHGKVDEAFAAKEPPDLVYVELIETGYRARVLRPGKQS